MTTAKEQEAFGLVIEHHQSGASENDIRYSFQRFLETVDLAAATEMPTEVQPGQGNSGKMDLYVHFLSSSKPTSCITEHQFRATSNNDRYLDPKAGTGVRNGILTDGVHYFQRRVGEEKLPLLPHGPPIRPCRTSTPPARVPPRNHHCSGRKHRPDRREPRTPFRQRLRRVPRRQSPLAGSLRPTRGSPTVAVKRRLWQDLLQVALGTLPLPATKATGCSSGTPTSQPDSRHHAAATPGRRRTTRRRKTGRPPEGSYLGRAIRPARRHRADLFTWPLRWGKTHTYAK